MTEAPQVWPPIGSAKMTFLVLLVIAMFWVGVMPVSERPESPQWEIATWSQPGLYTHALSLVGPGAYNATLYGAWGRPLDGGAPCQTVYFLPGGCLATLSLSSALPHGNARFLLYIETSFPPGSVSLQVDTDQMDSTVPHADRLTATQVVLGPLLNVSAAQEAAWFDALVGQDDGPWSRRIDLPWGVAQTDRVLRAAGGMSNAVIPLGFRGSPTETSIRGGLGFAYEMTVQLPTVQVPYPNHCVLIVNTMDQAWFGACEPPHHYELKAGAAPTDLVEILEYVHFSPLAES